MKGTVLSVMCASLLLPPALEAQREPPPPPDAPRAPRRPPNAAPQRLGPWNRDLLLLRSRDGSSFGQAQPFVERGGVPCLTQDARGRLIAVFQWFPMERREDFDRIAVKFSEDQGSSWTEPRRVEFSDLPEEYARQFDPTLVVLEDGRYRLYFTSSRGREPGREITAIYSAISTDAVHFTFEPGQRFAAAEENVVDCAVARLGDTWHLYAPLPRQEGRAYHAISKDGLQFERQPDVEASLPGTWIGNVLNVDGTLRFFGSGRGGVWTASSKDGAAWRADEGSEVRGGDPAVWRVSGGEYLMVVTGGLRADAPMDPPWQRARADAPPDAAPIRPPDPGTMTGGGNVAMTVADGYLYVFRDGVVYQFGARELNFIRQAPLPEPRRGPRPPPVRAPREGDPPRPPRPPNPPNPE